MVYISVSYTKGLCSDIDIDRCSLPSGVQINVSYMTGLCSDVDIDRCSLQSGVQSNDDRKILRTGACVDCEFSHPVRILCSDVEIDLTRSYVY